MSLKNYCTIEEIENYLLIEISSSFEGQVKSWIEAMENYIDKFTGRNFKADTIASERVFDGDGSREIFIDDCVEISSVKVDGKEVDYFAYPANELPKIKIELVNDKFSKGKQNISVKAKWGYSVNVPADIRFACMVLVAGIINNSAETEGEIKSISLGAYNVTYKDQKQIIDYENAIKILESYRRLTI